MSAPEQRGGGSLLSVQQSLSLYLPALVLSLGTGIIAPVLPIYAKSFDISFGIASLALIVYQVGSLVATFPTGYMLDKIGRPPHSSKRPRDHGAGGLLDSALHDLRAIVALPFYRRGCPADVDAVPTRRHCRYRRR